MFVRCHGCGEKQLLDTRRCCELCGAVLRRCVDCSEYVPTLSKCQAKGVEIEKWEADKPGPLAVSVNCEKYRPRMAAAV